MGDRVETADVVHVERFGAREGHSRYAGALRRSVRERPDVTFIPAPDASRRFRREAALQSVGCTVLALLMLRNVISGERNPAALIGLPLLWLVAGLWVSRAIRRLRMAPEQMPPFGLTIWVDALVSFTREHAVTIVPKSAVRTFDVEPCDDGAALRITALDKRGDTPVRTLGWFAADPGDLRATLDAWLTEAP